MKCQISNSKLIKYINNNLSDKETLKVKELINNSEPCKELLNYLEITFKLVDKQKKIEDNPYMYLNIINKIKQEDTQTTVPLQYIFLGNVLKIAVMLLIIVVSTYSGIELGNLYTESENNFKTHQSEFYFNDLNLETVETIITQN